MLDRTMLISVTYIIAKQ